jgi:hypothetical protein
MGAEPQTAVVTISFSNRDASKKRMPAGAVYFTAPCLNQAWQKNNPLKPHMKITAGCQIFNGTGSDRALNSTVS